MTESHSPLQILLVDDDPGDIRLTLEALRRSKLHLVTVVVRDGEEAMAYLRHERPFELMHLPHLILLDLNMPRKDGREVLAEIKAEPALQHIPVVILTTSQSEQDILKTYELGANCFVSKPVGLEEFAHVVQSIGEFWFTVVRLPKE